MTNGNTTKEKKMTGFSKWVSGTVHPKVGWAAFVSLLVGILLYELNLRTGWHPGPGEVTAIIGAVSAFTGYAVPNPAAGNAPLPAFTLETAPAPVEQPAPAPAPVAPTANQVQPS